MPEFLNAQGSTTEDVNDVNAEFDNLFGSAAQEPEESFTSNGHNTSFGVNKEEEVVQEITQPEAVAEPFQIASSEKPVIEAKGRDSLFNEKAPEVQPEAPT